MAFGRDCGFGVAAGAGVSSAVFSSMSWAGWIGAGSGFSTIFCGGATLGFTRSGLGGGGGAGGSAAGSLTTSMGTGAGAAAGEAVRKPRLDTMPRPTA